MRSRSLIARILPTGAPRSPGRLVPAWCLAAALIGATLLSSTGITVVMRPKPNRAMVSAETDEWYSCKVHACGCTSAEVCRSLCCCRGCAEPVPAADPGDRDVEPEADREAGSTGGSTEATVTLAIRAAACTGEHAIFILNDGCWLALSERMTVRPFISEEKPETHLVDVHNLADLTPDPPPPRPG